MPWDIQKNNYASNSNRSLFIYFFQFDLGCTSYLQCLPSNIRKYKFPPKISQKIFINLIFTRQCADSSQSVNLTEELGNKCKVVFTKVCYGYNPQRRTSENVWGGGCRTPPPLQPYFLAGFSSSGPVKTTLHWSLSSSMVLITEYTEC